MQGGKNWNFADRDKCKPVLPRLSWAENLEKPPLSLYGWDRNECRERGYGAWTLYVKIFIIQFNPFVIEASWSNQFLKLEITCIHCSRPSDPF
jgi:hypothetical protein